MGDLNDIRQKFIIPFLALGIINLIVNSFLIHALRRLHKLRTISYKLILCLTISDLFTGIELIVEEIMTIMFIRDESSTWRLTFQGVSFFFAQFSCLTTLAIAVDRYVHMKYLHKYSVVITNTKAILACVANLLLSLTFGILLAVGMIYRFFFVSRLLFFANASAIYAALSITYMNAYRALFRRTKQLNLGRGPKIKRSTNSSRGTIDASDDHDRWPEIEAAEKLSRGTKMEPTKNYGQLPKIETSENLCRQQRLNTSENLRHEPQIETFKNHGRQPEIGSQKNLSRQPQTTTSSMRGQRSLHRGTTQINLSKITRSVTISTSTMMHRSPKNEFTKAVMCVLVSILIFYLPYFVVTVLRAYNDERKRIMKPELVFTIWLFTVLLVRLHSCVNAIILMTFDRQLRRYTYNLFRKNTTHTNHHTSLQTICTFQSTRKKVTTDHDQ